MAGSNNFLATALIRFRGWIALAWVVICVALLPLAGRVESILSVAARIAGSESAEVDDQLAERFDSPFAHSAVLVVSGLPPPSTTDGEAGLQSITDAVEIAPGVTNVVSYLDQQEEIFAAQSPASGTFIIVGLAKATRPDLLLEPLRLATRQVEIKLRPQFPNIELQWTGEIALNADLRLASAADAQIAERRALPIILVLLILAFGAWAAALLPIFAGLLAIGVTLGLAAFIAQRWPLSILLQNVVTMIGLGLGIDYSLLMVSRFREELNAGRAKTEAAKEALRHAGPTILLSGAAVAIGFAALAATPVNELRSVAVAGLIVVVVSVLVATTLLPGLLATLGRQIDRGRLPLTWRGNTARWTSWARYVVANPILILILCGGPVCFLAAQARHLRIELPRGDWLPRQMESAQALRTLQTMHRSAVVQTIRVVLELPSDTSALSDRGWEATDRVARAFAANPAVASVRSLPGLIEPMIGALSRDAILEEMPPDIRRTFVSRDLHAALLEIIPREQATPVELKMLVNELRNTSAPAVTAVPGSRVLVGGLAAFNTDYQAAIAGRFFQVVRLIVGFTFIVLVVGFRSLLIPVKAIVLNLLAVAGAFGAVKLVFQDGMGAALLGLSGPLDGIFAAIPVLVFCIVFGLSMDYEVFLVARVREARQKGLQENAAVTDGVIHTGGLITSAAAIMIVVFGAFIFGDFLLIKILGFALAVAVLLDATVMRLAVSPALLTLAGRWNWWPGERAGGVQTGKLRPPGKTNP